MIFKPQSKQELEKKINGIYQPLIPIIRYLINNKKDFKYISDRNYTCVYMNQIGSIKSFGANITEFRGTKNKEHFYISCENLVNIIGKRYDEL